MQSHGLGLEQAWSCSWKNFKVLFLVLKLRSLCLCSVCYSACHQCFIQTPKHWGNPGNEDCCGRLLNEARIAENRGQWPRAGVGFLGRGRYRQLEGLRERCGLPQRGLEWSPDHPKVSTISALRMASADTIILLIVSHKKMKNIYPIKSRVNYLCIWWCRMMRLNSQSESRKRWSSKFKGISLWQYWLIIEGTRHFGGIPPRGV